VKIHLIQIILILSLTLPSIGVNAQVSVPEKHLRISVLTCGAGTEIYSVFGHSAVRVVDSTIGSDIVYNYGTFDGFDKDFEMNFMRGKLLYYLSSEEYNSFMSNYFEDHRWVEEQVLFLSTEEKTKIENFLLDNIRPENRAYHYDFFFDNCSTRIRDIFEHSLGSNFKYPNVLPSEKSISFRTIINQYLHNEHWALFGINILLGSKVDKNMSNAEIMFLPDFLRDGIASATLNGQVFSSKSIQLLPAQPSINKIVRNDAAIIMWLLAIITIIGMTVPSLKLLGAIMSNAVLIITGLLGVLIIFMWLGTNHQTCSNNFNLLWALPTNLFFIFRKKQHKYAMIAIIFIFISLLLHLFNIQRLPLLELSPLLLMLLFTFGKIYRNNNLNTEYAKNTAKE
jgi:hypothetical protein